MKRRSSRNGRWKANKNKVAAAKKKRGIRAAKIAGRAEAAEKGLTGRQIRKVVRQKVHEFLHPNDVQ